MSLLRPDKDQTATTPGVVAAAIAWSPALISKYDQAGPRYTSYPTALQFNEGFTETDYRTQTALLKNSIAPLSLYLHIPFCHDICYYCACNKIVTTKRQDARQYLDYLHQELALQGQLFSSHRKVTQLHWGGGTPTFLDAAEITELMHITSMYFSLLDDDSREYSIEIDPRTIKPDTIALLKGLGFNRLSLGVQDFDQQVQNAINRIQPVEMVRGITDAARRHHFKSISYDLIYGLPFQSVDTFERTLDEVIALSPDRIACYNYAHMPHRFTSQRAIDRLTLPSAAEKLLMLTSIAERLQIAGYVFIGMDHFVKPTDDLAIAQQRGKLQRNFQGYATCMAPDLVGIGMSSIGTIGDCHVQNHKVLKDYYQALDRGRLPVERGIVLTAEDKLRRYVIMQLICQFWLDFAEIKQLFGIDPRDHFADELKRLAAFEVDGIVSVDGGGIAVLPAGRPLVRHVCLVFDAYNQPTGVQHVDIQTKRFSRIL
jgi:oxygen-independent coproporphyrinogen III oxidase